MGIKSLLAAAIAAVVTTCSYAAEPYPTRPIKFVVGYAAGGSGDIVARILGEHMSKALGQTIVVENRAGASGAIAAQGVATSEPNGLTILIGQLGEIVINPHWVKNPGYDAATDLIPVAMAGVLPLAVIAPNSAEFSTFAEMIAVGKKRPLTFGSPGPGTPGHFAGEVIKLKTGANLQHVPYKGASLALNDLLGGHVDLNFAGYPTAAALVQSKKIKLLAVTSAKRSIAAPDVPTVAEAGPVPDYDVAVWVGLFVPKGTPPEIIQKLNAVVNEVEAQSDVKAKLLKLGAEVAPMSVEKFGEFVRGESNKYAKIIQDAKLKNE